MMKTKRIGIMGLTFMNLFHQRGPIELIQLVTEATKNIVSHLCLLSFVVGIALYVFPDPTSSWPAKGKNLMRSSVTAQFLLVFSDMIFDWITTI